MTIISRDCIGGVVYHQYGLRFLSPTINLYLTPEDFNLFCLNLPEYIDGNIEAETDNVEPYPTGILKPNNVKLKPIKIFFMHYDSFQEAKEKWDERKKRIQWNNIYVISNVTNPDDANKCSKEMISNFNRIPYKKVMFVDRKQGFCDEFVLKKPKNSNQAWVLQPISKVFTWKKVINRFNFNKFFNK